MSNTALTGATYDIDGGHLLRNSNQHVPPTQRYLWLGRDHAADDQPSAVLAAGVRP